MKKVFRFVIDDSRTFRKIQFILPVDIYWVIPKWEIFLQDTFEFGGEFAHRVRPKLEDKKYPTLQGIETPGTP